MAKKLQDTAEDQVEQPRRARPVEEIINQFLRDIENHPDAQFGNCDFKGSCPRNLAFPNTPLGSQHLTQLRIVYRDPMTDKTEELAKRPWKYQAIVDEINKQPLAPSAPPPDEKPNEKWKHLVPQKAVAEPVEVGV